MSISTDVETIDSSRRSLFTRPTKAHKQALCSTIDELFCKALESPISRAGDVYWCAWQPVDQDDDTLVIGGDDGYLLHRRDGQWARMQTPDKLPVHSLWGSGIEDLWGVGWMGQVVRFDGERWQRLRGGLRDDDGRWSSDPENTPLFAVTGDGQGQMWAVGDHGLILHYDGSSWNKQHSGTYSHLRAVACSPCGKVFVGGADATLMMLSGEQGAQWQALASPFDGTLQSLYAESGELLLIAGGAYSAQSNRFVGRLARLQHGDGQSEVSLLSGEDDLPRLRHISRAASVGPVLLLGDSGFAALVQQQSLQVLKTDLRHDLLGGNFQPGKGLYLCGDFATLLSATTDRGAEPKKPEETAPEQGDWQRVKVPTRRQLWAIAEDASGAVVICGDAGTILRRCADEDSWQILGAPTQVSLNSVCSDGKAGFFAAGQVGQIHHYDGAEWTLSFDLHLDITILALRYFAPDSIFAVGDEGLILHWNGEEWQRMSSGTKSALYAVWGVDDKHVLTVGDFGLVLRWNGEEWKEFHVGTENFLFSVWGDSLTNIYTCGLSGTVAHFDGQRWQLTPVRAREDLLAIDGRGYQVYAVGVGGMIMRLHNGQWYLDSDQYQPALRCLLVRDNGEVIAAGDQGCLLIGKPA